MKKAELKAHRTTYRRLLGRARSAERKGDYRKAIDLACSSWHHIDGMMQYERKYEGKQFETIEALDIVLKYAPPLFDLARLAELEIFLGSARRIEKNTSHDLAGRLAEARQLMWQAHRLWDHLERNPESREEELLALLGGSKEAWRFISDAWNKMELIRRRLDGGSTRVSLSTRMSDAVLAKCSSCGVVARACKSTLLQAITCPKCADEVLFVILTRAPGANMKG